jgi:hypothetical protein
VAESMTEADEAAPPNERLNAAISSSARIADPAIPHPFTSWNE